MAALSSSRRFLVVITTLARIGWIGELWASENLRLKIMEGSVPNALDFSDASKGAHLDSAE